MSLGVCVPSYSAGTLFRELQTGGNKLVMFVVQEEVVAVRVSRGDKEARNSSRASKPQRNKANDERGKMI